MRQVFLFIVLLLAASSLHAQDTLRKYNGKSYNLIIEEVEPFEIAYRMRPDGPVKSVAKSEVESITYADGRKETFLVIDPKKKGIDTTASHLTARSLYEWGKADAVLHYPGSSTGNTATFLFSFLFTPLVGLVPAVTVSNAPPLPKNFNMPMGPLSNNMYYQDGYGRKARSIKSGKVWISWAAGSVASAVTILLLSHVHN